MSTDGLLFDTSPLEGEGQKKKRSNRKRPEPQPSAGPVAAQAGDQPREPPVGFLLSLDSVPCWQCGAPADLAEVLIVDGRKRWRVMCGWWCMTSWLIDPIPGLLHEQKSERPFVVREGRFAGKTFDEIEAMGESWYITDLASLATNARVRSAAQAWLARKKTA